MTKGNGRASFDLFAAMAAVDLANPPAHYQLSPVGENETVVGAMSENLSLINHVGRELRQEADLLRKNIDAEKVEHRRLHTEGNLETLACPKHWETIRAMAESLADIESQSTLLSSAFWALVRLEFPETGGHSVGVREGGQVVWFDEKDEDENPDEREMDREVSDALAQALGGRPSSDGDRGPLSGIGDFLRSLGGRGKREEGEIVVIEVRRREK